ncbi:MAG: acyl-ACP--UDP-N-acetylglucosamine O-acyltransferase [Candidatus Omnitrophica bacterium]|nr:acyl-ACP--UDP-N-acetylglucosamine O-acyltransferase [Candidatus Omnitrophota bacterium]
MAISERAIVSRRSKIAPDVEIGPFCIIEDEVEIGPGVRIWPHAYICSGTKIGEGTHIHMGAVIGNIPQDLAFEDKKTYTIIGKKTVIREYATIHRGTKEDTSTVIGDNCYLMAVSHVGHNCSIGNNVIIANGALLAGYIEVGDSAFISGNVVIHQFCRIGTLAMIGGFTGVNKDVPPYMLVRGPSAVRCLNLVGLRRAKIARESIHALDKAFSLLYRSNFNIGQAVDEIEKLPPCKEVENLLSFISSSKRGICRNTNTDEEFFG